MGTGKSFVSNKIFNETKFNSLDDTNGVTYRTMGETKYIENFHLNLTIIDTVGFGSNGF